MLSRHVEGVKGKLQEKRKLVAKIENLPLVDISALNQLLTSGRFNFAVAMRCAYADDGILSEVSDILDNFNIPDDYTSEDFTPLNKRTKKIR